jgi:predicted nuclease of predicted toxin-antitoxin system
MNVLLDECLPKKLKREVEADKVTTVPEAGWASKTNGELLRLAEANFDVLLTNDQNLERQQHLRKFDLSIIVLVAPTNDIEDLKPLMPAVNKALKTIKAGEIEYIK